MEIKNYSQGYEQGVVDCWNRCCTFDPIDVKKFNEDMTALLNGEKVYLPIR